VQREEYGHISYAKLFDLMAMRNIKKIDLRQKYHIHAATISRLVRNESVNIDVIAYLCEILCCQPGDILEFTSINGEVPSLTAKEKRVIRDKKGSDV
jgi:DNA-binding Xre family transcriptional regulator